MENSSIEKKLDVIIKLMVSVLIENKNFDEKIIFLARLDLDNETIANYIGAKASTVAVRKSQLKKMKKL